jgi:hypothetical protein
MSRPKLTLTVGDLVIRRRVVEIPCCCPTCGADLSYGKGLSLCYLSYGFWKSKPSDKGDEVAPKWEGEGNGDNYFEDKDLPCVGAYCLACGESVIDVHMKTLDAQAEEVVQETVWSAAVGKAFFN